MIINPLTTDIYDISTAAILLKQQLQQQDHPLPYLTSDTKKQQPGTILQFSSDMFAFFANTRNQTR